MSKSAPDGACGVGYDSFRLRISRGSPHDEKVQALIEDGAVNPDDMESQRMLVSRCAKDDCGGNKEALHCVHQSMY
jgi:hypothetical protein